MKLVRRIIGVIKKNVRAMTISLINALAVFLLCYFIDNMPYSFVGDATIGQHYEQIKQLVVPGKDDIPPDVLFVNVAYDRELVNVADEFGLPKGNIDTTDRSKLLKLLTQLKTSDYKYIILDISFSNEYRTGQDDALFQLINKMDKIVVAKNENEELADSILENKARCSNYSTHISESNFVKYEYIRNGAPTLPYQVYLDLGGDRIHSFAGFYSFKGKLANKSIVLRHPIKLWSRVDTTSDSEDLVQLKYHNLGSDILDIGIDVASIAKNKIVLIGDFTENDLHDTYLGKIAGPIINLNAYYGLVNDNLSIPYFEIIFLLIFYFTISVIIIKGTTIYTLFPIVKKIGSKTLNFVLSFIGLSFILSIIALLWYVIFELDINILIPSLYFSVFEMIVKYHKIIAS